MNNTHLTLSSKIQLQTEYGDLNFIHASLNNKEALVVFKKYDINQDALLVRIQSSCVFSETFHTIDCDCASQLASSLKLISEENGLVIYIYDEGRGAGLFNKIEAIKLQQDKSINTVQAFNELGLKADERAFEIAIEIMKTLVAPETEIELLTNNPYKSERLIENGIKVTKIRPIIEIGNEITRQYLLEKKEVLGHLIDIDE